MSWINVGMAAAGAVKGGLDANANRKKAAEHDKFRKRAIEMSPWSGMGDPGAAQVGTTDSLSGMLGGGMQGAMLGGMMGGTWGGGAKDVVGGATDVATGSNVLGGKDMASQLGQQGQNFMAGMPKAAPLTAATPGGSAGAMGSSAWSGMPSSNLQQPTLGSGMMGLNDQVGALGVYNPKNMFGRGI